jgi:pimeloyl-ACP methyl ester carboxylesterase
MGIPTTPTVSSDHEGDGTRTVNGVRLYCEEHGTGASILCIHGGGSTALMWGDAVRELARLGRVIAYDRHGCTRSERPEPYERTSVAEQADDAAALIDALAAAPAAIIGRSYGGAVAIELALRHPDRVRALVLLEGDALSLSPAALEWTRGIRDRLREVVARDGVDAVYAALIGEVVGEGAWDSFPTDVRRILTRNGPALLAELGYVDEPMPDAAAFATIHKPTLLVAAAESPPEQREMTEAMAHALPNARTAPCRGRAHDRSGGPGGARLPPGDAGERVAARMGTMASFASPMPPGAAPSAATASRRFQAVPRVTIAP